MHKQRATSTLYRHAEKLIVVDFSLGEQVFTKTKTESAAAIECAREGRGQRGRVSTRGRSVAWASPAPLQLYSRRIVSDSRRFIFPARADHFFSRLGSLSVATIVIKSRVNEPHWIGTTCTGSAFVSSGPPARFIALIRVTRATGRKEPLLRLLSPSRCSTALLLRVLCDHSIPVICGSALFCTHFPRVSRIDMVYENSTSFRRKGWISLVSIRYGVWKFWKEYLMCVCKKFISNFIRKLWKCEKVRFDTIKTCYINNKKRK